MYFVLTKDIIHPETQEPIVQRGDIVSLKGFQKLNEDYGIDYIDCHACVTREAAICMQRGMV